MKNLKTSRTIPTSGWGYKAHNDTNDKQFGNLNITYYLNDDKIEVCSQVEINAKDDALNAWPKSNGLYEWNRKFSAGRLDYENKETGKFLRAG